MSVQIDNNGLYSLPAKVVARLMSKYYNAKNTFIADQLLPKVIVDKTVGAGKIAIAIYNAKDAEWFDGKRALKAPISQIESGYFETKTVELEETSGKIITDVRTFNKMLDVHGSESAVHNQLFRDILDQIALKLEYEAATILQTTSNYNSTQVHAKTDTYWDTSSGLPYEDIQAMLDASPIPTNTLWFGKAAWSSVITNENVRKIMSVNQDRVIQPNWFMDLFKQSGITNLVVGNGVSKNADGTTSNLWGDKVGALYVSSDLGEESFGRNFATTSTITMTRELNEHNKLHSHAGTIDNVYSIVSKRAGNIITAINDPSPS